MRWPSIKVFMPCLLLIAPIIHVPMPSDSSATYLRLEGGRGTYSAITTNCDGDIVEQGSGESEYIAAGVEHRFSNGKVFMGFHGIHSEQDTVDYENGQVVAGQSIPFSRSRNRMYSPYLRVEDRWAGSQLGFIRMENPLVLSGDEQIFDGLYAPSIVLRLGPIDGNYFQGALMDPRHLNTLGYTYGMLSVKPSPNFRLGAGLSLLGAHRGMGYVAIGEIAAGKNVAIEFAGRLAPEGRNRDQGAFSIGINYRLSN